ncbi:hypothetical protein AALO_G00069310 [Alosa alosa]|uniref:Uncharacterized protein n=1 Tax=Alosa alosa TaxID=278164 RepID=A0AAV6H633_9TELE|nr:hypothetical protein AALO_G00069310 [Alosa alosa]
MDHKSMTNASAQQRTFLCFFPFPSPHQSHWSSHHHQQQSRPHTSPDAPTTVCRLTDPLAPLRLPHSPEEEEEEEEETEKAEDEEEEEEGLGEEDVGGRRAENTFHSFTSLYGARGPRQCHATQRQRQEEFTLVRRGKEHICSLVLVSLQRGKNTSGKETHSIVMCCVV